MLRVTLSLVFILLFNISYAVPNGIQIVQTDLGAVYANEAGMTLYINPSAACIGPCLKKWPQAKAVEDATAEAPFTIQNGNWYLNGQALHTWVLDLSSGQTTGHNVGGVWFAAQPEQE